MIIEEHKAMILGLHNTIIDGLNRLANNFEFVESVAHDTNLDSALAEITKIISAMSYSENLHQQVVEHSFLFFIEQILKELKNLEQLISKVNGKNKDIMV